MDDGVRSVGPSGVLVKKNSSGCLIVRKKPEGSSGGGGSSSSRQVVESKKEKKRSRLVLSDSGSSDEILAPPRRKVGPETTRVCNGLRALDNGIVDGSEFGQKRERLELGRLNEDSMIGMHESGFNGGKRSKLEVFEFDEYDAEVMRRKRFNDGVGNFGGRRLPGSSGIKREFETGSSRHAVDNRKNSFFDRTSGLSLGDHTDRGRFDMNRDGGPLLRHKFMGQSEESIRLQGKNGVLKVKVKKNNIVGGPLENYNFHKSNGSRMAPRGGDITKSAIIPPLYPEPKLFEKPVSVRTKKSHVNLRRSLPSKHSKGSDSDSEDSDTSLKPGPKSVEASKPMKRAVCKDEDAPSCEKTPPARTKESKAKRGSGTEKQKLRERIREMLLGAGWTIDYRPRRNRDYLDAVYINPSGTAYWSIIKAYDAFQKQMNEEENEAKASGDGSSLLPITDDVLSQLTRKTRKKIEKELKKKQRADAENENARRVRVKRFKSVKHDPDSMDSVSYEEKLSSYLKQGGKSFKGKMNENGLDSVNSNGQSSSHLLHESVEKPFSGSTSHMAHGRKSRQLGRCTLLVRGSKKGVNAENDGFVPYTGKRTLLSWLVDSGTVQLSQKVQYMNRRRTKVMLEGWITRDGIHCGCCSKILTMSKFEIHAGSKLRQPFQNICLESGISLLQCQIDAWNRQEGIERIGFHSVQVDGDDSDDDTCGLCGDGGDLICCDGCPSTFHQSCLNIQMLPPGDWHCPNCICKFCGVASKNDIEEDDATALLSCSLCGRKSHISCSQEMHGSPSDSSGLGASLCGQKCRELFENLKKYLGVKHELEGGFSWTLVHRTDEDQGFPQRVESNSKLAVALTVLDECFLPIVDRRSGINLIHNVLYNCGSNFNRLNFSGFYTAILERGDEIICAASIRFHGTKLAEMPFIGTRHIYRRQGMCRRLFCAIESALCSLKVEKLIIPAIAELMHTWTQVFGFIPAEESFKQEMRSMNILVFPGISMLEKLLVDQENEGKITANSVDEDAAAAIDSGSGRIRVSLKDTPVMSGSLDVSDERKDIDSTEGNLSSASPLGAELAGSTSDNGNCPLNTSHDALETDNKPDPDSPVGDKMQCTAPCPDASLNNTKASDAFNELKIQDSGTTSSDSDSDAPSEPRIQGSTMETASSDSDLGTKSAENASDAKCTSHPDTSHAEKVEIKPVLGSSVEDISSTSLKEDALVGSHEDDSLAKNVDVAYPEPIPSSGEDFACPEPIPSSGETLVTNAMEEVNGNVDSSFSCANGNSMLNECDMDIQLDLETKHQPYVAAEVASDSMQCEKSVPQA